MIIKIFLPKDIALRYKVLPVSKIGDVLTIATANPLDIVALDDLRIATSFKKIDLVLAQEEKIVKSLHTLYSEANIVSFLDEEDASDVSVEEVGAGEGAGLESLIQESKLPPIVRVVDLFIYEGLNRRASDIHIEPAEGELTVRFRIDGVLHQGLSLPKRNQSAIIARLKNNVFVKHYRIPYSSRRSV